MYFQDGSLSCVQLVVYINILGRNHREKALNNSSYNLLAFYPRLLTNHLTATLS